MIKITTSRAGGIAEDLQRAAEAAVKVLGQQDKCGASVSFVSSAAIRQLNRKFRNIDKPTDVLSFPCLDLKKPSKDSEVRVRAKDWPLDTDGEGCVFLGDIIICPAIAKKQAAEYGHSGDRELHYLFVHGLLHLFGFDHMEESDKKLMREREEQILCMI